MLVFFNILVSEISIMLKLISSNIYISGYYLSANKVRLSSNCTMCSHIFFVHLTPPLKLWQNIFELSSGDNNKDDWKPVFLILNLSCVLHKYDESNAA